MKIILSLLVLLVLGAGMVQLATGIPFGAPAASDMDDYYLRRGQEETGANNIVTAILFDYRAIDTIGEASVLFTAVLGVGILFRKLLKDEDYEND